jgi:hypothetical protein
MSGIHVEWFEGDLNSIRPNLYTLLNSRNVEGHMFFVHRRSIHVQSDPVVTVPLDFHLFVVNDLERVVSIEFLLCDRERTDDLPVLSLSSDRGKKGLMSGLKWFHGSGPLTR